MTTRSFQAKLLYLFIGVLVLLQTATLVAVHFAGRRALRTSMAEEVRVGSRLLERTLDTRGRQLSDSVRVLASDFAFKETVASADAPTIASVLSNHGARIGADAAFLISLDGGVQADTLGGTFAGRRFPFPALLRTAEQRGEAAAVVTLERRPYQLVVVPVLAPRPIAWVCMGFAIDDGVLQDVRRLTSLELSLWNADARETLLSTLPEGTHEELRAGLDRLPLANGESDAAMEVDGNAYESLVHPLKTADGSRVFVLLQRRMGDAARPFRRLELQIFVMSMIALGIAIVAAIFFAHGVSRPLEKLVQNAQRIERGDYATAIDVRQEDEIGRLATALDRMRTGIADREEQIRHQSTHDSLTGLPNRTLFLDRLEQAIAHAKNSGEIVAIIIMDVDRFKEINDTLGHQFGDELLGEVGRRLSQTLRETANVARLGGDEFAVTIVARDPARAQETAERLGEALETPFALAGVSIDVGASMGIALYPTHASDAATLMKRADIAMYDAKKSHLPFAVYEPGRDEHSLRRLSILSELRHAITRDELELHYQPKIEASSDCAAHAEALVRWRHPEHGLMSPDEFIPIAEQSGNIALITRWVLRRAITDCARWTAAGVDIAVAVNLSALDLFDAELPAYIGGLLHDASLPPAKLALEITESAIMSDPAHALGVLRDLKQRGLTLAIDDYGTGYSSLAHLKRLPVDELKIDKSFVLNLRADAADDLVIVRSTIELGHNMGLRVIAEGVENDEAWQLLKGLGCDMAQGFFFARPLPLEEFLAWNRVSRLP